MSGSPILISGSRPRLTSNPANDWLPAWSPDNKYVALASDRSPKGSSIYRKAIDGSGEEELLVPPPESGDAFSPDWSRDGQFLIYQVASRTTIDLWMLPIGERKPRSFLATQFVEWGPRFSPDSKWMAYSSNESGTFEIYVTAVGRSGKQQVSTNRGAQPPGVPTAKNCFS